MKNFSESDRRGGALFGIVGCMAILLINCIWSTGSQSMILFCISCTAMFSMMQLADVSSPGFTRKYRWLMYFFAFAPCAWATSHLVRERARILEDLGAFVVPTLFIAFFLICYSWYFRTHGVESEAAIETSAVNNLRGDNLTDQ